MKKLLILAAAVLSLSACSTTEKTAAIGAGTGAVIGGVASGNVYGAAAGAIVGGAAGALIGHVADSKNMCTYRAKNGKLYTDYCPKGYKY